MKLSVIIPVFNEAETIFELVERVRRVPLEKELVLVDDSSFDGSGEILARLGADADTTVLSHPVNRGKGVAIATALHAASGDVVVIQDADLEYNPQEYPELLKPILDGRADVVYGSRFQGSKEHRVMYFWHYKGNQFLTLLSNMFTNLNLTDMETCYKVFRFDILKKIKIQENRFGFEPEITAKIAQLGCRIYEVGISYSGRTYAEGKKISWKDGLRAIWCVLKYNLKNTKR